MQLPCDYIGVVNVICSCKWQVYSAFNFMGNFVFEKYIVLKVVVFILLFS